VEVLTPDFLHNYDALDRVIEAAPEVFNHNTETVPTALPQSSRTEIRLPLDAGTAPLCQGQEPRHQDKSGLMLGMGETREELFEVLTDLRDHGCDFLTLGQYLQPGPGYLPVVRYVPPEEFEELGQAAKQLGFHQVASGPSSAAVTTPGKWPKRTESPTGRDSSVRGSG
jgi:lipoyl synthase